MSDTFNEEVAEARRKYFTAIDDYHKLVNEFVSVIGPGESSFELSSITTQELIEAEAKIKKAREQFIKLIRES